MSEQHSSLPESGPVPVELLADVSPVLALLAEFSHHGLEIRHAFVDGLHALGESAFSSRIDFDAGAAGAAQCRIGLEPSKALLDLAATFGARDIDLGAVENAVHECPIRKEM